MGLVLPSLISASHVKAILHQTSSEFVSMQRVTQSLLSSLLGIQSLTYLHVSDLDLLSIPDDIGCLSSLEHLNLSGNLFVSLPESMSQLSNLRRLHLECCIRLQSLENVPLTIDFVIANHCKVLKRLPGLQFYPFMSDHSHLNFQCVNCFELADYIQSSDNILQVSLSLSLSLTSKHYLCFVYFRDNVVDYQTSLTLLFLEEKFQSGLIMNLWVMN